METQNYQKSLTLNFLTIFSFEITLPTEQKICRMRAEMFRCLILKHFFEKAVKGLALVLVHIKSVSRRWKNYKDPDVPQLPNLCTIKGQQIYELIKILFFVEKVQFLNLYGKIISTKILFIVISIFPYQRTGSNLKRNYF